MARPTAGIRLISFFHPNRLETYVNKNSRLKAVGGRKENILLALVLLWNALAYLLPYYEVPYGIGRGWL